RFTQPGVHIAPAQHRLDSRQWSRFVTVNPQNVGMRMRAAQECGVQQTGHANVVDISSLADQQPSVFQPGVARSDRACGQLIARMAFSTTSLGVAYNDATMPSTSAPLTGLLSIIVFFASAT